jgi:hypothetical protein
MSSPSLVRRLILSDHNHSIICQVTSTFRFHFQGLLCVCTFTGLSQFSVILLPS